MHLEVEQKFPLTNLLQLVEKLAELGATLAPPVEQADLYFNHPAKNFKDSDEALRIRRVGGANWVTYKGPKLDAETKTRRELEVSLGEGEEAFRQFSELLVTLGFVRVFDVRKRRATADLVWQDQRVQIAVDDVLGLGQFVELEISAEQETLSQAKAALASLAEFLDLRDSERRGYLDLLLEQVV